jgi:hypothetical protein
MNTSASAAKATANSSKRTLDIQHTNKLTEFQAKAEKLASLRKTLSDIEDNERSRYANRKDLEMIEEGEDEIDYLINTAPERFFLWSPRQSR